MDDKWERVSIRPYTPSKLGTVSGFAAPWGGATICQRQAAFRVGVDVQVRRFGQSFSHQGRRPVRILIGVQLDDRFRPAAQLLGQNLKRQNRGIGFQLADVGPDQAVEIEGCWGQGENL